MEVPETIQCPFCGESFDLLIEADLPNQRFITDCEICCRPLEVIAKCESGEVVSIDVLAE